MRFWLACALAAVAVPAQSQEDYGAKGIFPVYETSGQWVIFDKRPSKEHPTPIGRGQRFLVVGSLGANVFEVRRTSGTYGGSCRGRKPLKLRAALLVGPRRLVGRPIIGIHVPEKFTLKDSRAVYLSLSNQVNDATYAALGETLREAAVNDAKDGKFRFRPDDGAAASLMQKPEAVQIKIDFGVELAVEGLKKPFVFVEESGISASSRRCLRVAENNRLVAGCAEMPHALMAETALLQFVAYDPSGRGNPFVLAFTKTPPLWGDERWGFAVRATGPRLFLMDAMDLRCRESF